MSLLDGASDPGQGNQGDGNAGAQDLLGTPKAGAEPQKVAEPAPLPEWLKGLPEPLQKAKSLAKFKDGTHVENLAKSYVELESKLGRSIELPGKDATDEDKVKFFARIGRPMTADDYEIGLRDAELAKRLRAASFNAGLTKEQVKAQASAIAEYEAERDKLASKAYTDSATKADRQLREEFGAQYDIRMEAAKKGYESLYSEGLRRQLAESGVTNNPEFIRVMSDLGMQIKEASLVRGKPSSDAPRDPYYDSMAYLLKDR